MQMTPTIDFTTYSDDELETSLPSINRDKFEQNYLACLAEIEKRKTENKWKLKSPQAEQDKLLRKRRILRAFAFAQVLGALFGIGNFLLTFGPLLLSGHVSLINSVVLVVLITLLGLTAWAGLKYWMEERDWKGLWRILLIMQIPAFNIGGLGYEFYSGFTVPIGLVGERLRIDANIATNAAVAWDTQSSQFAFTINLAAIAVLFLLGSMKPNR